MKKKTLYKLLRTIKERKQELFAGRLKDLKSKGVKVPINRKPAPKGHQRIERSKKIWAKTGNHIIKALPRDLGNANLQVVTRGMFNPPEQQFKHLTLWWAK